MSDLYEVLLIDGETRWHAGWVVDDDSETDVLTARAAGVPVALVRHGYAGVPAEALGGDAVADDLASLPALLEALLPAGG